MTTTIEAVARAIARRRMFDGILGEQIKMLDPIGERFDAAFERCWGGSSATDEMQRTHYREDASAAMEALADNLTEEMASIAVGVYNDQPRLIDVRVMRRAISAAIRAGVRG